MQPAESSFYSALESLHRPDRDEPDMQTIQTIMADRCNRVQMQRQKAVPVVDMGFIQSGNRCLQFVAQPE